MYLVVIGWIYVVLMMSVAEASNSTGSVLGAIVTFFLYGLLPVVLVVYLMRTPQRRKAIKEREAAEHQASLAAAGVAPAEATATAEVTAEVTAASNAPDAGGHASGAAEAGGVAAVRKEP